MAQSYREIIPELAHQVKLVMTDVDGTLISGGPRGLISSVVLEAIHNLEELGIVVGLVSGRTLTELEPLAQDLGVRGPMIAENGAVAKLEVNGALLDLGYSRRPTLVKTTNIFPAHRRSIAATYEMNKNG